MTLINPFNEDEPLVSIQCEREDHYECPGYAKFANHEEEKCGCFCHKNLHDEPEQ